MFYLLRTNEIILNRKKQKKILEIENKLNEEIKDLEEKIYSQKEKFRIWDLWFLMYRLKQ
jgi:hypothetical protein